MPMREELERQKSGREASGPKQQSVTSLFEILLCGRDIRETKGGWPLKLDKKG